MRAGFVIHPDRRRGLVRIAGRSKNPDHRSHRPCLRGCLLHRECGAVRAPFHPGRLEQLQELTRDKQRLERQLAESLPDFARRQRLDESPPEPAARSAPRPDGRPRSGSVHPVRAGPADLELVVLSACESWASVHERSERSCTRVLQGLRSGRKPLLWAQLSRTSGSQGRLGCNRGAGRVSIG
jgi:hypothetical protein